MNREERKQLAEGRHDEGYNCCQCVLCACCDLMGMDQSTAASLGYGFAGGMYCGEVCGAVSGGLMAVGAACLSGDRPIESRADAVRLSRVFEERFEKKAGSLLCREIITANGKRICNACIAWGTETAAEIIESYKRERTSNDNL